MTREEQINEFAYSQVDCEFFDERLYEGIIIGANWADEHPKPGMVNKEEFIEKARKWISNNKDNYIIDIEGETLVDDQIITDFCKIMEN